jgi:hypothetical protein
MIHEQPRHQAGGVPSAGDEAAEGAAFGRLGIGMKRLRVKPLGKGHDLIRLDRDRATAVDVAFDIIFEVPIGDRTQKWHSQPPNLIASRLDATLSRGKPTVTDHCHAACFTGSISVGWAFELLTRFVGRALTPPAKGIADIALAGLRCCVRRHVELERIVASL